MSTLMQVDSGETALCTVVADGTPGDSGWNDTGEREAVRASLCGALWDEPQDLSALVTSTAGLPSVQRELRALVQEGVVAVRYGLYLLTVEGRNQVAHAGSGRSNAYTGGGERCN